MCKSNNILNITSSRLQIITLKMEERENYCYIINFPLYYLIFPILWLASLNTAGRRRTQEEETIKRRSFRNISNVWGLQHKQSHSSPLFIVHSLLVCCTTIYIAPGNEKKEACICILWHKRLFTVMVTTNILLSLTRGAWQNFLIRRLPNLLQIIYILFWRRCCCLPYLQST